MQIPDTRFTPSLDPADDSVDIGPAASLGAFDGASDIFAPAASLFGDMNAFSAEAGAPAASAASIVLLNNENWQTLVASIDIGDISEALHSATSFTLTDPRSGVSVQFVGTGFTTETVLFQYLVLAAGTITGFNITQNGLTIATGNGFAIKAATLLGVIENCIAEGGAQPLFDMWLNLPVTVGGTAAAIAAGLSLLKPHVDITAIDITGGAALAVNLSLLKTYETVLNKVAGGFDIEDTVAKISAALIAKGSALIADAKHVDALVFTNGASALLKLTAAQDAAAASLLAKVSGDAIVAVHETNHNWVTLGQGDGLTIDDIKGVDAITVSGADEAFVLAAGWGKATISGFDNQYAGSGHDFVTLAKSAFAQGDATLLADAKAGAGGIVVTAGTDQLTFTGLTLAELKVGIAAGDFKFV